MTLSGIIFDCDGVLAETERDGHLPAFNAMFRSLGVPVAWSSDQYAELLAVGGGKERLSAAFSDPRLGGESWPVLSSETVREWHAIKTKMFVELVESGQLTGRPGVARVAAEAAAQGVRLAVASTSSEQSVAAVLRSVMGPDLASEFTVFAGDTVQRKKPAPDIYLAALRGLQLERSACIAIEDSAIGCAASVAAGIPTLVTRSHFTHGERFDGARLVVDDLDGDDPPSTQLHLADIEAIAAGH